MCEVIEPLYFSSKIKGIVLIFSLSPLTYGRMTDCLAYASIPHCAKQMETIQAEAGVGKDVLHSFVLLKRNNWAGFLCFLFWYLDSELGGEKNNPELIAVTSVDLDSIKWEHICN